MLMELLLMPGSEEAEKILPNDLFTGVITMMYQSPSNACFSAIISGSSGPRVRRSIFYDFFFATVQSRFRHYHHHQNAIFGCGAHRMSPQIFDDFRIRLSFFTRKRKI
jgi:hypothetical protein